MESHEDEVSGFATSLVPRCTTLRQQAGMSMNALAREARVDRGTLTKIERRHPVTATIANRVFNALNVAHKGKLSVDAEVTSVGGVSRVGTMTKSSTQNRSG